MILVLSLALVGLWCYSLTRAATLSFTHDECYTYRIVSEFSRAWRSANNHVLNTLLMKPFQLFFGDAEFSLRLPNSLAHGVFLVTSYLCMRRVRGRSVVLFGPVLWGVSDEKTITSPVRAGAAIVSSVLSSTLQSKPNSVSSWAHVPSRWNPGSTTGQPFSSSASVSASQQVRYCCGST